MKKGLWRFLSIIITSVMLWNCLQISSFGVSLRAEPTITSGQCGVNAYWSLDVETKTLTISGYGDVTGDVYAYKLGSSYIENVIIEEGITGLECNLFYDCKQLTSVSIASTVKRFGGCVFGRTPWLEEQQKKNPLVIVNNVLIDGMMCEGKVVIPNTVQSIAQSAFANTGSTPNTSSNYNITSVSIPSSVTFIDKHAFWCCKNLEEVIITPNTTKFGENPFWGTKWEEANYRDDRFFIVNHVLLDVKNIRKNEVIPNDVYEIGDGLGGNAWGKIESIVIPDTVTRIGNSCFAGCQALKSVSIGKNVSEIGHSAFNDCGISEIELPDKLSSIGQYAFEGSYLKAITIPASVQTIGVKCFCNCPYLESVVVMNPYCSFSERVYEENLYFPTWEHFSNLAAFRAGIPIYGWSGSTTEKHINKWNKYYEEGGYSARIIFVPLDQPQWLYP